MAVVGAHPLDGHDYSRTEQELQDHILDIYGTRENEVDLFRPSLADHHKVGFFTLDRCSQTEISEVVDLKSMTEVLQVLLQDVTNLRRDINLTKHVMQADYENKLQEKAMELYVRINEKVKELERIHEDRVTTVRRAFKQQLSDAIARVAVLYNKNLERKIKREKKKQEEGEGKHNEQFKEMQATIQRNETVIQMLKMQLAQYAQRKNSEVESPDISSDRPSDTPASPMSPQPKKKKGKGRKEPKEKRRKSISPSPSPSPPPTPPPQKPKKKAPPPPPEPAQLAPPKPVEDISIKSKSPSVNEEFEALKEECDGLHRKIDKLEEGLEQKEDENSNLKLEINQLTGQLEKEKATVTELKNNVEQIKQNAEKEKSSSKLMIEKQKLEMQKQMEEKMRAAKEEAMQHAASEAANIKEAEQGKIKLLMDQKRTLEQQLQEERRKNQQKTYEEVDAQKYQKNEQKLRDEIIRLKKEIERVHRTWEKKFAILQQSLHALKDESYIRVQLQRQAAALHHAAVSYAVDTPVGIMPQKNYSPIKKPVVPEIPKKPAGPSGGQPVNPQSGGVIMGEKDYISYTVSAPSGRGTAMMSVDENQVMSDAEQEDIPDDVQHIPPPPPRPHNSIDDDVGEGGMDSQLSSSRSHVVVMPTAHQ
ncbi:hypothetical protein FSP39_008186 [Pinctada imbricata]|uniref:DUF4709 domain-containing protein n=1 Tax=Pinctada imbricata TaxID=66713 RepID=A0AA88YV06_PINIB|nr:hypothetical protein FSP39_008186 [Pinctada imbricata]